LSRSRLSHLDLAQPVVTLVVATCMEEFGTTVFVIEPPPDDHDQTEKTIKSERVAERTGVGSYRVPNADAFASRIWTAQESSLLKWAGSDQPISDAHP
jgi:hypothetical protein